MVREVFLQLVAGNDIGGGRGGEWTHTLALWARIIYHKNFLNNLRNMPGSKIEKNANKTIVGDLHRAISQHDGKFVSLPFLKLLNHFLCGFASF